MNANYSISIIKVNYKDMKSLGIGGLVFQCDNDSKHKCVKVKDFLKKKKKI